MCLWSKEKRQKNQITFPRNRMLLGTILLVSLSVFGRTMHARRSCQVYSAVKEIIMIVSTVRPATWTKKTGKTIKSCSQPIAPNRGCKKNK